MGSVWKRLNHINKRASKFRFIVSYQELCLEAGPSWQPTALSIVWTRRGRRIVADPVAWEPTMKSPYVGMCVWPVPDNKEIMVTLFRDQRQEEYDNKDWFFILEDVKNGKRKPVAQGRLNLKDFATQIPSQHNLTVKLRPLSKKVTSCYLVLSLSCEFLKEGKATDDDMRSVASLVSNSTLPNDIADLETLDEAEEQDEVRIPISDLTALTISIQSMNQQLENLSHSLQLAPTQSNPVVLLSEQQLPPTQPPPARLPLHPTLPQARLSPEQQLPTAKLPTVKQSLSAKLPSVESSQLTTQLAAQPTNGGLSTGRPKLSTIGTDSNKSAAATVPLTPPRIPDRVTQAPPIIAQSATARDEKAVESNLARAVSSVPTASTIRLSTTQGTKSKPVAVKEVMVGPVVKGDEPAAAFAEPAAGTAVAGTHREKIQKTKSQELREFTQEFVATSTIDFDPMSFQDHQTARNKNDTLKSSIRPTVIEKVSTTRTLLSETFSVLSPRKTSITTEEKSSNVAQQALPVLELTKREDDRKEKEAGKLEKIVPSESFMSSLKLSSSESSQEEQQKQQTPLIQADYDDDLKQSDAKPDKSSRASRDLFCSIQTDVSVAQQSLASQCKDGPVQQDLHSSSGSGTSSDLLEWAKTILKAYPSLKVTNFTTSWRNGLAFCAIIHSFYPDLIPSYSSLTSHEIKENCKAAFEAGELLGIPRVVEPEKMAIMRVPDKLAVMTYLHQLRSGLGTAEANSLYASFQAGTSPAISAPLVGGGVRKSFSEGNIKLFSRTSSIDISGRVGDLPTLPEEGPNGDTSPPALSKYRQKAKDLMAQARLDSSREKQQAINNNSSSSNSTSPSPSPEKEPAAAGGPSVVLRQRSITPRGGANNRLSYIDNEIRFLDAEQMEIDRQAAILDKRLRETSEEDELVYDGLLQQWFILVNKKNALLRRQMQLNLLEKEEDLEKKFMLLQEELRTYAEMEEERKTNGDREREQLLLQELVLVVNQRNELVLQRDEEERMIENDEQIEQDITLPEEQLVRGKHSRDECRMQ